MSTEQEKLSHDDAECGRCGHTAFWHANFGRGECQCKTGCAAGCHEFKAPPAGAQDERTNSAIFRELGIEVGPSSLSWQFRDGLRVDATGGSDESRFRWLLKEASYLIDDLSRRQQSQAEEIARLRAENERLTEERDEAVAENQWTVEEHQKAWAALRQSEGTAANTFASFEERVWWKEAIRAREEAESQVQALQARLSEAQQRIETLTAERAVFVARCREIRDGSPNAFYAHVDAYCKAAPQEDQP